MKYEPKLAVIVLQCGQWRLTRRCLDSICASEFLPSWIIVVDNASPDNSADEIEKYIESAASGRKTSEKWLRHDALRFICIRLPVNGGYAAGNNAGIRLAMELDADAVLILNNDTVVEPAAIGAMAAKLFSREDAGLCGAMVVYPRPGNPVQCLAGGHTWHFSGLSRYCGGGLPFDRALEIDEKSVEKRLNFICGACVMAKKEFVESAGLMNEGYFLYCEEQDWVLRDKRHLALLYASGAVVYHYEGATTGWSHYSFQWKRALMLARSRIRLAWLHYPWYLPTVAICCGFAAFRKLAAKIFHKLFR